ncbi:MAG: DUF222 domain-containing protein [Micrococcales bacterium]|nr:DUF222 domain-containing protein [Micrococcales bacterium]
MSTPADVVALTQALALPDLGVVGDDALMGLQRELAGIRRRVDAASADVAAEIARRSRRELGYAGLAQRLGARTPEKLIQTLTGSSTRDARALVEVGQLLTDSSDSDGPGQSPPRLSIVAAAIRAGTLSIEQAHAIRVGLGAVSATVTDADLDPARAELANLAPTVTVEDLRAHARVLRDELDAGGVAAREAELRERRFLRLFPQEDGMTRLVGLLDPESAARVQTIVDAALSPRRGGPRFVEDDDQARAERIAQDPRSNDQIALDVVVDLLEVAADSDRPEVRSSLGRHGAPVQVLVTQKDLATGTGFARIGGQEAAVSIGTAERRICADGGLPIFMRVGRKDEMRLGRTRRRFSARQRTALAARDGCCRRCGRAVSQTEAHHIRPWSYGGDTDLDNAILLCRFDHLLVHNNGWQIEKDASGEVWFVPPADVDPLRRRLAAHPPNPVHRRLVA